MRRLALACLFGTLACGDDTTPADTDTDSGTESASESDDATTPTSPPGCADPFELACESEVEAACEGPLTAVVLDVPAPSCPDWNVEDDAIGDYPVGVTPVTFTMSGDGMDTSCTTDVLVVDEVAPEIECPPPSVLVRASEDEMMTPPPATATDGCDDSPMVSASTAELAPGFTEVVYTAVDASGNEAMCAANFGVVDAFAVPGYRILSATTGGGVETDVTLAWEPAEGPHIDALRVETSDAEDGPWQEVATLGPTDQLYTFSMDSNAAWYRVVSVAEEGDGGATAPRRAFRVTPELYELDDQSVPGVPFATTLYGAVRYPTALGQGPFPFVLMLHGNHGNCRDTPESENDYCITSTTHACANAGAVATPNAEGYVYLLETLAAQGFVAVSISANALNCRDDFILERSGLIAEHLRRWSAWSDADGGPFGATFVDAVDMTRVGLMGHSRGGDAVAHVHEVLEQTPAPGVNVRSVFSVGPTDFHEAVVPDSAFATLLPSCDGDVVPLSGQSHYDRSIDFDTGARRAQVLHIGANHNFYNTQWQISEWEFFGNNPFCTPDDDVLKLEQTSMLEGVLGSWFWSTVMNDEVPEAFVRADAPSPSSFDLWAEAPLELRWSYASDDRVLVDDFSSNNAPAINALGGVNTFESWFLFESCFANGCDPFFGHQRNVVRLLWEQGNVPVGAFGLEGYDASGFENLSFRVVSRRSTLNTGLEEQDFVIRLADAGGAEVEFLLSDFLTLQHLYPHSNPIEILQTVRLPLPELQRLEPALDLSALNVLEFEMTALDRDGSVIIADIEFAN